MSPALVPELGVTDWRRSRDFYCELLGFAVRYERPEEGFSYLTLGTAALMIDQLDLGRSFGRRLGPVDRPFGRGLNLQIEIPTIAPLIARLCAAGIAPDLAPEDRWYRRERDEIGQRQCVVADPDGYLLRFHEILGTRPIEPRG